MLINLASMFQLATPAEAGPAQIYPAKPEVVNVFKVVLVGHGMADRAGVLQAQKASGSHLLCSKVRFVEPAGSYG